MNLIILKNSLITWFQRIYSSKVYQSKIMIYMFVLLMIMQACIRPTYQDIELLNCGAGDKVFVTHYTFCIYGEVDEDGGDEEMEEREGGGEQVCGAPLRYYYRYQNVSICAEFENLDQAIIESAIKKWTRQYPSSSDREGNEEDEEDDADEEDEADEVDEGINRELDMMLKSDMTEILDM